MTRRLFLAWLIALGFVSFWPGGAASALGAVRGDFNGDGSADLAVGVPGEDVGGVDGAGAINVLYGGPDGLSGTGNPLWSQDSAGVLDSGETFDDFGYALASGDFNGDGRDDLAVGVPNESVGSASVAGAVNILYGGADGLSATGNQLWSQDSAGILDAAEANDVFGSALSAGDLNGDGRDDLAVGVPGEDVGGIDDPGAVNVLYGSAGGLSATGNQFWSQDSPGVLDAPGVSEFFGQALAIGDLNGDGRGDLAVGVPYEDVADRPLAGAVNVLYGGAGGLSATGNQFWHQNRAGVRGVPEQPDFFGWSLSAGDLNGDGSDDLAVGVLNESVKGAGNAGAVNVLYGSAGGLSATGNQLWSQDSAGVANAADPGDNFGAALAAGDLNGDGRADLAVGVPRESVSNRRGAGAVSVLYGGAEGLSATGNQLWSQDSPGVLGGAEQFDDFGDALSAGDLNGDGSADLAVGVPREDIGTIDSPGRVNVLYGGAGGLSAAGNQLWDQDSAGVLDAVERGDQFGFALAAG